MNTNGVISFKDSVEEFTPVTFPTANGQPMIAPYWADVDTRNGGEVFYRQSSNVELFQRATNDVKRFFPGKFPSFQASWVFIATWQNVSRFRRARSLTNIAEPMVSAASSPSFHPRGWKQCFQVCLFLGT